MTSTRQDAWSQDEDLLLAEVILKHIREGSTQLHAFEEVGKRLSRTPAACGFRWNSYVRKQYRSGIELAKKYRKESKRKKSSTTESPSPQSAKDIVIQEKTELNLKDFFTYVEQLEADREDVHKFKQENDELICEISNLKAQLNELDLNYKSQLEKYHELEEDYRSLLGIMEKARKMMVLEESEKQKSVKFKMDKNGNLQRVNK
ncbi:RsfA family transcriptional regulator [Falsibacillus albus]|uniref:RsfA family transcriptional regulator n=1 Tax=Falsibacillus albus TaxID=2478915 RepID=A0A3L7K048_9BACI|nr:RsfA family transcriptional regulator [Falsibacillus albus]RLQ95844.1 RsfA family transcriptional regulator [Falsibacillus albus]